MLSDEDRMIPHGRLLAVIPRIGGGESLLDEFRAVGHHDVEPLAFQVFPFSTLKAEPTAKGGSR